MDFAGSETVDDKETPAPDNGADGNEPDKESPEKNGEKPRMVAWLRRQRQTAVSEDLAQTKKELSNFGPLEPHTQGYLLTVFSVIALSSILVLYGISAVFEIAHTVTRSRIPTISVHIPGIFILLETAVTMFGVLWFFGGLRAGADFCTRIRENAHHKDQEWMEAATAIARPNPSNPASHPQMKLEFLEDFKGAPKRKTRFIVWSMAGAHILLLSYLVIDTGGTSGSPYIPALTMFCSLAPFGINRTREISRLMIGVPLYLLGLASVTWINDALKPVDQAIADGMVPMTVTIGTVLISLLAARRLKRYTETSHASKGVA